MRKEFQIPNFEKCKVSKFHEVPIDEACQIL
jgi:hypothetical protein